MPRHSARSRRHRAPDRRRTAALLTAAVVAAAGGAAAIRRRRGRTDADATSTGAQTTQPAPVIPGPPSRDAVTKAVDQTWSCECGQEYRVQGEDRHRIYWLADASVSDPVLESQCPECGRPLPREHEHTSSGSGPSAAA